MNLKIQRRQNSIWDMIAEEKVMEDTRKYEQKEYDRKMKVLENQKANMQLMDVSKNKKISELGQVDQMRRDVQDQVRKYRQDEWTRYTEDKKQKQEMGGILMDSIN